MPRKASGQPKISCMERKQANGDIYVYEVTTLYNPEKRYNEHVSSKLLGKKSENGVWVDKGATSGNIDKADNQIAIQVTESGYNIFTIDESGHIKYSAPAMNINFENTTQRLSDKLSNSMEIISGEEIPLWVKIGNNENRISIPTDFRSSNCTTGIAFTVTFSNNEIK